MKEATGELNLTVITVVAIGLMATFFFTIFWPMVKDGFDRDTACNKANCKYDEDAAKTGFYKECTYIDEKGNSQNIECPYKG